MVTTPHTKKTTIAYVGPRALFDPSFTPPCLISREREVSEVSGVLYDSLQDNCPVSILLTGLEGIGKTALARKAVASVRGRVDPGSMQYLHVNCKDRTIDEVLYALLHSIGGPNWASAHLENVFNYDLARLWANLKIELEKTSKAGRVWFFDSIEDLEIQYLTKFMQLGKEAGISTIGSHDAPMKQSASLPKSVDIHLNLEQMTPGGLYQVTKQRLGLVFPFSLPSEIPRAICDYVDNFDTPRPGTCIRVLKDVYMVLKQDRGLPPDVLRAACHRQVSTADFDDLSLLNNVLENDIIAQLFIDNISSYFQSVEYYIPENALREQYQLAAESLEVPFDLSEYRQAVYALLRSNILKESRIAREKRRVEYMLVPPPALLKNAIDAVFAKVPS